MGLKFARTTGTAKWDGRLVRIAQDDPWDEDDPFVKANPQHFADQPLRVFGHAGADIDVEQATAAPGEKRTTRRGK